MLYKGLMEQWKSEDIVSEIISLITNGRRAAPVVATTPLADTVLCTVSEEDEMVIGDMLDNASSGDQKLMEECIKKLISINILRYNVEGKVIWHSEMEKSAFKKKQ